MFFQGGDGKNWFTTSPESLSTKIDAKHLWLKQYKINEKYCKTTGSILSKLGTSHFGIEGVQVCSNEEPYFQDKFILDKTGISQQVWHNKDPF